MELVAIAKIIKPRGLKGEVVAEILTDFPGRFENTGDVTGVMPDGMRRELKIEDHWFQNDRLVLKFAGHDSVDQVEALRGAEICVAEHEAVVLEAGEFYDWQLVGCKVETADGVNIGSVRELMRTGGTEILVVDGDKEYLIPFAETICLDVDIENKLIRIDPPDGLLEF